MADLGIAITATLIEVIGSEAIRNICEMWGYKSDLEKLNKTVTTIKNVLFDAESKRELSKVQQGYISELKDAVYDADDLFDEFRTLVHLNQIGGDKGGRMFGKVRRFFSSEKEKLSKAHRMSCRVKEIKRHLDGIADNYTRYGFSVDYKPIVRRREDTCSYVDVKDIIGRDKDKEAIIDMLMAPNGDDEGFLFLTIVGVGGLGKTALAQLVFNDERIEKEFSSYKLWVCVSDQDGEQFDVRTILSKILEVITEKTSNNSSSMESVKNQFREQLTGKKYFLVLDDVWTEDRDNWVNLKKFLLMGAPGSKIVVTSRSEKTSTIIGSKHAYKLEGLSKEDSQCLFEMSAFEEGEKHPELVKIGENIARKCCGIPLAIKVLGNLLYSQDISKWLSIERSGLADIGKGDSDKILPILKLSYHNLAPSLKSCFSYCALFPKDYHMDKEMLIGLWMAQGYIVPLDGGQSLEDAVEEHFSILMRRCFFQDIVKDEYGNVEFVKIHDLMHDVAQEVGKEEICFVTSKASKLEERVRHVNIGDKCVEISLGRCKIRSCICNHSIEHLLDGQVQKLTALRVLNLSYSGINRSLPRCIDRLLLLRYLNLCDNSSLEVLPNSITRLYNLQTLVLRYCRNLREIPKDFSNLINLRHIDFYGCDNLNGMPLGMNKLTNLRVLPYFETSNEISDGMLKVLQQVFTKLKGKLWIKNSSGRRDLNIMKPLAKLTIDSVYEGEWVILEGVLEKLELPPYLNELGLSKYNGTTIPWSTLSFPQYILYIEITSCKNLEQIPVLSRLPNLKSLKLMHLDSMEYMEINGMSSSSNNTKAVAEFFPSLEAFYINDLPKLKGWWKGDFPGLKLRFARLSHLKIGGCPNLSSFAPCLNPENLAEHHLPSLCILRIYKCPNLASNIVCPSTLEKLELVRTSERLLIKGELGKLRDMVIDKVDHLKLLPPTNCLASLKIKRDIEVESALECVQGCASSLRTLKISKCNNLRRLPRLDHLVALEELVLWRNEELIICEDDEEPWKSLPKSLRQLDFSYLPKMKSLPKGMQHMTSLQSLVLLFCKNMEGGLPKWMSSLSSLESLMISHCSSIKSLPEAIQNLTSLKKLYINGCPELEERCEKPNGEDFSKIYFGFSFSM